jgi:hypothetical protein
MGKKICPMFAEVQMGVPRRCAGESCSWFVDGECAVVTTAKKEHNCRETKKKCNKEKDDFIVTLAQHPEFREAVGLVVKGDAELKKAFAEFCHTCNEEGEEEVLSPSISPSSSPSSELDALREELAATREYAKASDEAATVAELENKKLKEEMEKLREEMEEVVADRDSIARENEGWQQAYNELLEMSEKTREKLEEENKLLKSSLNDTKQSEFSLLMKEIAKREDMKEGMEEKKYEIYDVNGEMWKCDEDFFPNLICFRITWEANVGFGQLEFRYNTSSHKWEYDDECMSEEFCLAVLKHWLRLVYTGEKTVQRVD